jgi:ribulose kinase
LGAAIDAAVGLKLHPDFDTAIKEMTRLGDTFEPNLQAQAIYEDIYRTVYGKMYGRLKPLYEALRNLNAAKRPR